MNLVLDRVRRAGKLRHYPILTRAHLPPIISYPSIKLAQNMPRNPRPPRKPGEPLANPRHEAYARYRAAGKSKAEAYKLAGGKGDKTAAAHLENGTQPDRSPTTTYNLRARIQELLAEGITRAHLTPELVISMLLKEAQHCQTDGARIRAQELLGKAIEGAGLFVERVQTTAVERASDEELADAIARDQATGKIDESRRKDALRLIKGLDAA